MDATTASVGLIARLVAAVLRLTPVKRLEVTVLGRGIVAEIPYDAPCYLVDRDGGELRGGVYVLLVRLWNRGALPVLASDFPPSAPLQLALPEHVRVLGVDSVSTVESFRCDPALGPGNFISVAHEGFGPGDDAIITVYFTGPNLYPAISVRGRVLGQAHPLDRTHLEHRASLAERLAHALVLTIMVVAAPAFLFGAWMISAHYGWATLWHMPERIPQLVSVPFALGSAVLSMFVVTGLGRWFQRKRQPLGFPLDCDLEPPFWLNLGSIMKMIITGQRYRVSASLFSIGEPVLMRGKKVKRRSVKDWPESVTRFERDRAKCYVRRSPRADCL